MTLAFVAIGSNLGDRLLNIAEARRRLDLLGARTSGPIIETDAVLAPGDRFPQPRYLNTVDAIETRLSLDGFFAALRSAEVQMGRQRSERWAPRNIDLDLLLFGDETRATEELTLPHPRMHERDFVMRPLRAVAAQLPLPRGEGWGEGARPQSAHRDGVTRRRE
ncbi:MAG: 2-amino-4-hydroxy-6-hydroxymethyldihydropteridine diphosphokinase [Archangium sp.]|nr:2-amino-4-hydroxy-6-hydroxymethyldihydropteridine diphosphokinase [Archangium sp.]